MVWIATVKFTCISAVFNKCKRRFIIIDRVFFWFWIEIKLMETYTYTITDHQWCCMYVQHPNHHGRVGHFHNYSDEWMMRMMMQSFKIWTWDLVIPSLIELMKSIKPFVAINQVLVKSYLLHGKLNSNHQKFEVKPLEVLGQIQDAMKRRSVRNGI